jgi:hypothetical protein
MASRSLLEHYARFEQDWEIFADEEWRNDLFNSKVRGLSTHTKLVKTQSEGDFTPIKHIECLSFDELESEQGRQSLSFIDDEAYNRLLEYFDSKFYDVSTKGIRFNQKGVTVRIASGYNQASNRVYRNWNCTLDSDFGNIFFKKNPYQYGILISNYPVDDERNTLGFTGIKIIQSGKKESRKQETSVQNNSMNGNSDAA